jgi:hypothetical protein
MAWCNFNFTGHTVVLVTCSAACAWRKPVRRFSCMRLGIHTYVSIVRELFRLLQSAVVPVSLTRRSMSRNVSGFGSLRWWSLSVYKLRAAPPLPRASPRIKCISVYSRKHRQRNYDTEWIALGCMHSSLEMTVLISHASVRGQLINSANMTTVYFDVEWGRR